jgi:hypothetical protein
MTTTRLLVLAALAAALLALLLAVRHRGPSRGAVLADPVRTPGVVSATVTQANIRTTICRSGWTRTIRPPVDYTNALKQRQMHQYREHGSPAGYQEDHLISLELGGDPADPRNLWPEPYPRASSVDQLENELNHAVCSGALSLRAAQDRESELKHTQG